MHLSSNVGGGGGLIEEGDDLTLVCEASPDPRNYTMTYYFKVNKHSTFSLSRHLNE